MKFEYDIKKELKNLNKRLSKILLIISAIFIPILIILGIMKKEHKTLGDLSNDIDALIQPLIFIEDAINLSNKNINIKHILNANKDQIIQSINQPIDEINTNDGLKITFKNEDWLLCRPSGTEPLIRIYAESFKKESAEFYIKTVKSIFS